ncbi:MAG: alpha/beta hydrolase [Bacteroidetes bacterium]|nr:alpha/beta hydrolase [Bacteroidota bacterium]
MPFFQHDHLHFHYQIEGSGKPIFFLHGLGGSIDQAFDVLKGLKNHQIHTLAFRGHSQTVFDGRTECLNFDTFASDFEAFLNYLDIKELVLGGISMGAGVSLNFAIRYPERVKKLILHRPAWLNKPLPEYLKMIHQMACFIEEKGVVQARKNIVKTPLFQKMKNVAPEAVDMLWQQWQNPLAGEFYPLIKHIPASIPFESFEDLKKIKCPTLVIGTGRDPIHPIHFAQKLAKEIPYAVFESTSPRYVEPEKHQREVVEKIQLFLDKEHKQSN